MRMLVFLIVCCLVRCQADVESPTDELAAADLQGSWTLTVANGADPAQLNIGSHVANFKADGTWFFQSSMIGPYDGLRLNGSGEWRLEGTVLHCTAGDNSRTCDIALVGKRLTFSPDPLLVDNNKEPISTEYER